MSLAVHAVEDGPVQLAARRLGDAVANLVDPRKQQINGAVLAAPSLYEQMVDALAALAARQGAVCTARSLPPIRCDVLDLIIDIDDTTRVWWVGRGDTPKRLRALAAAKWRPQDTDLLDDYSAQLEVWVRAAGELLEPAVAVRLPYPCPSCGAEHAYRDDGGENVRTRALKVTEHGCRCAACGVFWSPGEFHWLARLLGCESLPEEVPH